MRRVAALADRLPSALKQGAKVDPFALIRDASLEAIDARGKKLSTALHVACEKGRRDVVAALIARGAALSLPGPHGRTPLHLAALHRDAASVRLLLAAGADARALDEVGESPLHAAAFGATRACVEPLLAHPASPDLHALGTGRRSVLALACWGLYRDEAAALDLVGWLLERGASADVFDALGQSPTHFACGANMRSVARLTAEHTSVVDVTGLVAAMMGSSLDVAETLIARTGGVAAYADCAARLFTRAALMLRRPSCEWVLARWPDVAVRDPAVSAAALERAIVWRDAAMVDYLLGLGAPAEWNSPDGTKSSLVETALGHQQWAIVPRLIAHGATARARHEAVYLADAPPEVLALFPLGADS